MCPGVELRPLCFQSKCLPNLTVSVPSSPVTVFADPTNECFFFCLYEMAELLRPVYSWLKVDWLLMHAAWPCPRGFFACCMCSFGSSSPYDSVLFSYPKENGCRTFSHLCRSAVFRSTSPPGIFPPTLPLFFLFMKAFSLRVRTTPQTFHSELYAEGLACLLRLCEHLFLLCFFSPPVPTQHYREHSYICHPTWDLFTLSQERWHMGCCINLSHSWWRQILSRMAMLESLLL